MAYLVNYDEITNFGFSLKTKSNAWLQQLDDIYKSVDAFVQMESFRGAAAGSVKNYLSEIHGTIVLTLSEIFTEIDARFDLYKDGYYDIDEDNHAQLCEETIKQLSVFLQGSDMGFDGVRPKVTNAISSVSDLISDSPPYALASSIDSAYSKIIRGLNNLDAEVTSYEQTHSTADFTHLNQLISQLSQFISQYIAMNNDSKGAYLSGSVADSLVFQELADTLREANTDREALGDALALAREREAKRLEELEAEWAKQRAEEGALKAIVGVLTVVGGVACIVATAGLATPLVVAGAVAGTATVAYGASEFIEGSQEFAYGLAGDLTTVSFNPMRDTIFGGNQEAYDMFGTVATTASSVLTLGAGGINAYAQGASRVAQAAPGVCKEAISAAGRKAVLEFGTKALITGGAGSLSGYAGTEIAKAAGASDAVASIIGIGSGMVGSSVAGYGMSKWEWNYEPGSRGIPEGVCFVAGTPVVTALGPVAIEKIKAGDKVISTNPETGETTEKVVLKTYVRERATCWCTVYNFWRTKLTMSRGK